MGLFLVVMEGWSGLTFGHACCATAIQQTDDAIRQDFGVGDDLPRQPLGLGALTSDGVLTVAVDAPQAPDVLTAHTFQDQDVGLVQTGFLGGAQGDIDTVRAGNDQLGVALGDLAGEFEMGERRAGGGIDSSGTNDAVEEWREQDLAAGDDYDDILAGPGGAYRVVVAQVM